MTERVVHLLAPNKPRDPHGLRRFLCNRTTQVGSDVPYIRERLEFRAENVGTHQRCRQCAKFAETFEPRPDAPPAVHATKQAPISEADRLVMERDRRGETVDRFRWNSLGALLEHVVPVMQDGRAIRSSSDDDRFGVRPQQSVRGSDPISGHDDVLSFEKALAKVTRRVVEAADRGAILGGVSWTETHLRALVLDGRSVEAKALVVRRTEHQTKAARRVVEGALRFELARIGLLPRPKKVVARRIGGENGLDVFEPDTDPKRHTEEAMAKIPGYPLQGWKQIAAAIERSEDWCQKMAARETNKLPVRRLGREVYGNQEQLDTWLRDEVERVVAA